MLYNRREEKSTRGTMLIALGLFIFFAFVFYLYRGDSTSLQSYPYQQFYQKYSRESTKYNIAVVSDMDKDSKENEKSWKSSLVHGSLERDPRSGMYSVSWGEERILRSAFNEAGRAMELSDLCNFQDKLYTFDDRTGLVFVIEEDIAYPVSILMDGNGKTGKGFKGEWCSVRGDELFIGGMGKEWTDQQGNFINNNPLFVKTINKEGVVAHKSWISQYNDMKNAAGAKNPGYILNEAGVWFPSTNSWTFLPRRVSSEKYDAVLDEYRCSNIGIHASSDFGAIDIIKDIGPLKKTRGFSSVKFFPHRENEIVVLKTEEIDGTQTYVMIYDLESKKVLLEDTPVPGAQKYEGIEFV